MPKMDLEKSYRYQGAVYGPGKDLEVPEAVAQVVRASQPPAPVAESAPQEPAAAASTGQPAQTGQPQQPADPPKTEVFTVDGIDTDTMEALREAGFDSAEKIKAASDDELLAVKGIGPATLEKLRAL